MHCAQRLDVFHWSCRLWRPYQQREDPRGVLQRLPDPRLLLGVDIQHSTRWQWMLAARTPDERTVSKEVPWSVHSWDERQRPNASSATTRATADTCTTTTSPAATEPWTTATSPTGHARSCSPIGFTA